MSAQALYRRWRSQRFTELVGQDHVTKTLRNAVASGRIAHAYLFCGPRGTGKTSSARILAKAVNCLAPDAGEPCNACEICVAITEGRAIDLIEIDAASNRGIDEIRDLRDRVNFAPNQARYKVYIIDEVHMLTEPAFNALLKTLEEPPPQAIFVLATTESHKVPATIVSRCQRFDFRRIPLSAAIGRLSLIAEREGISIDQTALELVTKASTGSLRDAENLLDQLVAYYGAEIELAQVEALLGLSRDARAGEVARALIDGDLAAGLMAINAVVDDGGDLRQFNREIVEFLRSVMLTAAGVESALDVTPDRLRELRELAARTSPPKLAQMIKLFGEADPRIEGQLPLPLELALVESIAGTSPAVSAVPAPVQETRPAPSARSEREPSKTMLAPEPAPAASSAPAEAEPTPPTSSSADPTPLTAILERVRGLDKLVEALLRNSCEILSVDDERLVLGFYYPYHKEKIEEPARRKIVEEAIRAVYGRALKLVCQLHERDVKARRQAATEDPLVKVAVDELGARIIEVKDGHG